MNAGRRFDKNGVGKSKQLLTKIERRSKAHHVREADMSMPEKKNRMDL
jgi:hypothetical protein